MFGNVDASPLLLLVGSGSLLGHQVTCCLFILSLVQTLVMSVLFQNAYTNQRAERSVIICYRMWLNLCQMSQSQRKWSAHRQEVEHAAEQLQLIQLCPRSQLHLSPTEEGAKLEPSPR